MYKISYILKTEKILVYMCLQIASIRSTAGNKTRLFPSPLLFSTCWYLFLAEALRNDHVAACSTAPRSAFEKKEMGGYATVPLLCKMTQHKSTGDWLKF